MAFGAAKSNIVQLAREVTPGTLIAATTVWRGPATDIESMLSVTEPDEDTGLAVPLIRSYIPKKHAEYNMPATPLTFEQFPHILEASIMTATPGAGTAYLRTYALPIAGSLNTLKTYTIETGNVVAGDGNHMGFAFVDSFKISGKAGEAWMLDSAKWLGNSKIVASLTGSLTVPTVEEALFSKTKLYIDAAGGTVKTTNIAKAMIAAEIDFTKTGWVPVFTADGFIVFQAIKWNSQVDVKASITFELENTTGVVAAERAFYESQATRLFALDCAGSDANHNMLIEFAGRYTKFNNYTNANGNTTVKADIAAKLSVADSLYCSFAIKNGVATLP